MTEQQCARCDAKGHFLTHQYVKLGAIATTAEIHSLCAPCFTNLRRFAIHPEERFPLIAGTIHCERCCRLKTEVWFSVAFDNSVRNYCLECFDDLDNWISDETK